jgi:polysaccharide export outer membrane protein
VFALVASLVFAGDQTAPLSAGVSDRQVERLYVLQPDDEITVHSLQVKELADKTFRIDEESKMNFPLIGRIEVSGDTLAQAEEVLVARLKTYYLQPDIELNLSRQHTAPVSVIGAVGSPGVHQMKGRTTLLDALSSAGGVRPDAGPMVVITRESAYGPIAYPGARTSMSGQSVAEIDLKSLLDARNPTENIQVQPHDVVAVPPAQVVYVVGNVKRAGGFPLGGKPDISVIQALALAEGLDPRAAPDKARILRRGSGSEQQIAVDLKKILAGKAEDLILHPSDILFVPSSAAKTITTRTIEAAIQMGTAAIIFAK